jgi:iron complex transport system ATP-binding protein
MQIRAGKQTSALHRNNDIPAHPTGIERKPDRRTSRPDVSTLIKKSPGRQRPARKPSPPGSKQRDIPPLLEFENVTVIKGNTTVLDSVSFTIAEGENVAILGPNGAGKSSLIKTINREYYPVASARPVTFRIRGKDNWDVFDLRAAIGIVSNDLQFSFARDLPAREAVISGFFSSNGLFMHKVTPDMERKADGVMKFLGVAHLRDRPMTALSSGEARRVLIARALVHEPKTLILDEPTNSLDLNALHTFRATLQKIAQNGTGIIMVTHNLHDIIPEISRVILMKDGRFIADGRKEEILNDERIGGVFDVPVRVKGDGGWYYATGY